MFLVVTPILQMKQQKISRAKLRHVYYWNFHHAALEFFDRCHRRRHRLRILLYRTMIPWLEMILIRREGMIKLCLIWYIKNWKV